jgi:hypothetical protein
MEFSFIGKKFILNMFEIHTILSYIMLQHLIHTIKGEIKISSYPIRILNCRFTAKQNCVLKVVARNEKDREQPGFWGCIGFFAKGKKGCII